MAKSSLNNLHLPPEGALSRPNRRGFLKGLAATAGATALGSKIAWGKLEADHLAATSAPATWPGEFNPASTTPAAYPRDLPKPGDLVSVFNIEVVTAVHEILPGVQVPMFLYNGSYPGPEIRLKEGEWVQVNLRNRSFEFHTIHWHGIQLACEMDGVPLATQWPVGPNQEFRYLFRAQPDGTHFYHCHYMTTLHVQAGLMGPLIIEPEDDPIKRAFPYTREYVMALSECDTNFVSDSMNEMAVMSKQMEAMNQNQSMMAEMNGKMMGWFANKQAFLDAIKDGYIPPYLASKSGVASPVTPNYFMINGKSYPMTEPLMIKKGEIIRVRLIGGGMMPHYMHLHGHDFWHVCQDGSPLASPVRHNTIPIHPGSTSDIIIEGTNPGNWHFHDHSDLAMTNNGQTPGGMMTMLMYEDASEHGFTFKETIALSS